MRIRFQRSPSGCSAASATRLSFDQFDGRNWSRGEGPRWQLPRRMGQRYEVPKPKALERGPTRRYLTHIYLEPLQTDLRVLFTPPQTRAIQFLDSDYDVFRGRRKRVQQGLGGDFTFKAPRDTSLAYAAEVEEAVSESARRKAIAEGATEVIPQWINDRWTQLPKDVDPRIRELAREIVGRTRSPLDRALKIQTALRNGWTYSLAGDQDPEDPLGDFMFGNKSGHCEYFATSMAVMMRSLGHPARVVNGYLGGQFNNFGDYRMIKQGDAHAWVEVFFAGYGWATFEPTPPGGQLAPEMTGVMGLARRVADGAAMLWYSWVVEYDLERQVAAMRQVGRMFRKLGITLRLKRKKSKGLRRIDQPKEEVKPEEQPSELPPWIPPVLAALVVFGALLWWRTRRAIATVAEPRLHKLGVTLERLLARHGLQRQAWETWTNVAEKVGQEDAELERLAQVFARDFDRARYGSRDDALCWPP